MTRTVQGGYRERQATEPGIAFSGVFIGETQGQRCDKHLLLVGECVCVCDMTRPHFSKCMSCVVVLGLSLLRSP